jgi:FkbM family methyltransferase
LQVPPAITAFFFYNTSFDALEVMHRHAAPALGPTPRYLTNYLGVLIDPKLFPTILGGRENTVEAIPIPANWHADIAEWAAALRAVDLAGDTFTVVELGCGWGCWLNNTGVAARRLGKKVRLVGVEGDEGHAAFAVESTRINGFTSQEVEIHRGIAAATGGIALFPRQKQAGISWALEPVFGASEAERARARKAGTYDELPMIAMDEVVGDRKRIDLLHIDIQGGEADLVAGCLDTLARRVAYMVIGTHSRQIEGRLFQTLLDAGWQLEIERPAILALATTGPTVTVDGVQGWRNPRIASNAEYA